jgi:hypothetical protein
MTQRDQVAAIGAAIGKDLTVTALTRDEALAQFARFMPSEDPRLRLTPPAGHPGRSSF